MDEKTAKELAGIVVDHAQTVAQEHGLTAADLPAEFCALWPKAKPVLSAIAQAAVFFFPQAGAVLGGLIKVGDGISAGICE